MSDVISFRPELVNNIWLLSFCLVNTNNLLFTWYNRPTVVVITVWGTVKWHCFILLRYNRYPLLSSSSSVLQCIDIFRSKDRDPSPESLWSELTLARCWLIDFYYINTLLLINPSFLQTCPWLLEHHPVYLHPLCSLPITQPKVTQPQPSHPSTIEPALSVIRLVLLKESLVIFCILVWVPPSQCYWVMTKLTISRNRIMQQ